MSAPGLDEAMLRAQVEALKAENTRLMQEARRYYLADGSYIGLDPAEVIERRKAAARENTRLRRVVERRDTAIAFAISHIDETDGGGILEALRVLGAQQHRHAPGVTDERCEECSTPGATSDNPSDCKPAAEGERR